MTGIVDLHNEKAGHLLRELVKPVVAAGGGPRDIIVLLESLALGVFLFVEQEAEVDGPIEDVIDNFAKGVKLRFAEQRAARKARPN